MTDYRKLRVEYTNQTLNESDLAKNPLEQFRKWMTDASELPEPNAMVVATADESGQPSSRLVLLKEVTNQGFVFYSNYASRKGREIEVNPKASLVFPWFPIFRQVVIVGSVSKVSREESENYFHSRPHDSQLAAFASDQSTTLTSRDELEDHFAELKAQYPDGSTIPLPENWGGYLVAPSSIEFWSGRKSRMHDRFLYEAKVASPDLAVETDWKISRLSP
jgi:pyridoxamine 5'-phosphate oxidase